MADIFTELAMLQEMGRRSAQPISDYTSTLSNLSLAGLKRSQTLEDAAREEALKRELTGAELGSRERIAREGTDRYMEQYRQMMDRAAVQEWMRANHALFSAVPVEKGEDITTPEGQAAYLARASKIVGENLLQPRLDEVGALSESYSNELESTQDMINRSYDAQIRAKQKQALATAGMQKQAANLDAGTVTFDQLRADMRKSANGLAALATFDQDVAKLDVDRAMAMNAVEASPVLRRIDESRAKAQARFDDLVRAYPGALPHVKPQATGMPNPRSGQPRGGRSGLSDTIVRQVANAGGEAPPGVAGTGEDGSLVGLLKSMAASRIGRMMDAPTLFGLRGTPTPPARAFELPDLVTPNLAPPTPVPLAAPAAAAPMLAASPRTPSWWDAIKPYLQTPVYGAGEAAAALGIINPQRMNAASQAWSPEYGLLLQKIADDARAARAQPPIIPTLPAWQPAQPLQ